MHTFESLANLSHEDMLAALVSLEEAPRLAPAALLAMRPDSIQPEHLNGFRTHGEPGRPEHAHVGLKNIIGLQYQQWYENRGAWGRQAAIAVQRAYGATYRRLQRETSNTVDPHLEDLRVDLMAARYLAWTSQALDKLDTIRKAGLTNGQGADVVRHLPPLPPMLSSVRRKLPAPPPNRDDVPAFIKSHEKMLLDPTRVRIVDEARFRLGLRGVPFEAADFIQRNEREIAMWLSTQFAPLSDDLSGERARAAMQAKVEQDLAARVAAIQAQARAELGRA